MIQKCVKTPLLLLGPGGESRSGGNRIGVAFLTIKKRQSGESGDNKRLRENRVDT